MMKLLLQAAGSSSPIGLLLLALFIWFLGPYFAFGDIRPLERASAG